MTINYATKSNPAEFKAALNRLGSDHAFRQAVLGNPELLTSQHNLSLKELHALRQAAIMSGVDMTEINRVRANEMIAGGAMADSDVDVSCCCCCCCGETGGIQSVA